MRRCHMAYIDNMLDDAMLFEAWERVRKNKGAAGVDGQTVQRFSINALGRLLTLKHQVERGEYRPRPLLEVHLSKPSGGMRRLAIPAVRDRVLQGACARVLAPVLEKAFEEPSFAYRSGRSVAKAVERITQFRDQGYQWVVDADIQSFFDEVDHALLLAKLRRTLEDHSVMPLIELWMSAVIQPRQGPPYLLTRGIPQGAPISPLLANLYLDDLDEALINEDLRFVRFSDDFVILCRHREAAEKALAITGDVLKALRLSFKREKTRLTNFDEGFRFLGVDFIRNLTLTVNKKRKTRVLPDSRGSRVERSCGAGQQVSKVSRVCEDEPVPEVEATIVQSEDEVREDHAAESDDGLARQDVDAVLVEENASLSPLLRSLYVTRPGLRVLKKGERLVVKEGRDIVASIPLHKLDQIVIQGNQLVSSALLRFANKNRASVAFVDQAGSFVGHFSPNRHRNLELERSQYQCDSDDDFKLMMAHACVVAKIHNSRVVLRRFVRRHPHSEVSRKEKAIAAISRRLTTACDLNSVRGIEGAAARAYFEAICCLLPDHWGFSGRRRRPPTDPFNVLLSYGYGVLFHTMDTLVRRRGLNPWLGTLHASVGRHEALVSDLIEEFRPIVVDSIALNALLYSLSADDFIAGGEDSLPCRLRIGARKKFLNWIQNRLRSQIMHPGSGRRLDYHRLMQYQVWHYARVVTREDDVYRPYRSR